MKKTILVLAIVLSLVLAACSISSDYNRGYSDGMEAGYEDGRLDAISEMEDDYSSGYDDGYFDGYSDGYSDADMCTGKGDSDDGYDIGYEDGYEEGESDGYYSGATYACLFFGDVDRAFKCAANGSSWHTFIDAYDEYISDIYNDDSTRSDLFGAFVSVMISGDATQEERNLLADTFGEELFINNGITLFP